MNITTSRRPSHGTNHLRADRVHPLSDQPTQGVASTDIGDISWFVPVGQLTAATYTFGAPGHSWQIVACTGTSIGEKGMLVAARADFKQVRDPLNFVTLIPEGQQAPKAIR